MIFVLFILTFKLHLLKKSSNLQRRVCKPLADLDKSTMSSAYIRQDICKPQLPGGTGSHWSSKHFDKSFRYTLESPYHLAAVSGAHFTQGTILSVILVSSGSAKSRTHQSAVGGFLVTRRGRPGRLRACRIWTFINSV